MSYLVTLRYRVGAIDWERHDTFEDACEFAERRFSLNGSSFTHIENDDFRYYLINNFNGHVLNPFTIVRASVAKHEETNYDNR